jgi:predicted HicB family RNase H-like nuclease
MTLMMNHRGYTGMATYDPVSRLYYGKVMHIREDVTFRGRNAADVMWEFRAAVNAWLEYCAALEKKEQP